MVPGLECERNLQFRSERYGPISGMGSGKVCCYLILQTDAETGVRLANVSSALSMLSLEQSTPQHDVLW